MLPVDKQSKMMTDIYSSPLGHSLAAHDLLRALWIVLLLVPCWCVETL